MALPSAAELEKQVVKRLTAIDGLPLSSAYASSAKRHDLYEALAFAALADAARRIGGEVTFHKPGGAAATEFRFRDQPGDLWDPTPYTYARLDFAERGVFEVHLGVYASGGSRLSHECDVLVLREKVAEESRTSKVPPRAWRKSVVVECKFYARRSLPLGIGRAVAGTDRDLRWFGLRGGMWWPPIDGARSVTSMLVSSATNVSVLQLLEHHSIGFAGEVSAQSAAATERLDRLAALSLGRCVWA